MKQLDPLIDRVSTNLQSSLLCITENGHLGLVPYGARSGGTVAILMGCSVPFVLRNVESEESCRSAGPFWWIGEAYVHDIMDRKLLTVLASSQMSCIYNEA